MTHRIAISAGALGLLFAACSSSSDSPPTGASYTNGNNMSSTSGSKGNASASSDAGSSSSSSNNDPSSSSSSDDPSPSSNNDPSSTDGTPVSTDAGSTGSSSRSRNGSNGSSSGTDAGSADAGSGTGTADAGTGTGTGNNKGTTDAGSADAGSGTGGGGGNAGTDAGTGSGGGNGGGGNGAGTTTGTADCSSGLCGPVISGHATWFDAHGTLNCSFPAFTDWMVGAPSLARYYNGGKACGECIQVTSTSPTSTKKTIVIRVVDSCPDCDKRNPVADLDLSQEAFQVVDDLNSGYVAINFQVVPCTVNGPMQYRFKDGCTQSWMAIQVINHREPIATVDYADSNGNWINLPLTTDNFFTAKNVGTHNPLKLRITSVYGQVVVDTVNVNVGEQSITVNNTSIDSNTIFTGTQQFE